MRAQLAFAAVLSIVIGCGKTDTAPPPPTGQSDGGGGSSGGPGDAGPGTGGDAGTSADAGTPDGGTDGGTAAQGPEVLTTGENAVALAIDANNVYWLNVRTVATSDQTYTFVDVRSMRKTGGAPSTLVQTNSMSGTNIVAPDGVVVWSASSCAPPCDYPGADSEQAIFTLDSKAPGGYRMITGANHGSQVAATATTSFSRRLNGITDKWDLQACAIDGSGCTTVASMDGVQPALYVDSGRIYWINVVTTRDSESGTMFWNDVVAPYTARGQMGFPSMNSGLRVDGAAVATRSGSEIWTGTVGGQMTRVWVAPGGSDIDISHGRMYWNQRPSQQFAGCLGSANLDGTDGKCLDEGQGKYDGVKVDEDHVWYIRDGQIVRVARN